MLPYVLPAGIAEWPLRARMWAVTAAMLLFRRVVLSIQAVPSRASARTPAQAASLGALESGPHPCDFSFWSSYGISLL